MLSSKLLKGVGQSLLPYNMQPDYKGISKINWNILLIDYICLHVFLFLRRLSMLESGVEGVLYNWRGEAISATILDSLDLKLGFRKASRPVDIIKSIYHKVIRSWTQTQVFSPIRWGLSMGPSTLIWKLNILTPTIAIQQTLGNNHRFINEKHATQPKLLSKRRAPLRRAIAGLS